jgi:hypothetical protein
VPLLLYSTVVKEGDVAQLVEQRTENPCVGGSIPSITTLKAFEQSKAFFINPFPSLTISFKNSLYELEILGILTKISD